MQRRTSVNKRHIFIYKLLRPLVVLYIKCRFDYRYQHAKELPEKYMILSNHATDFDPLLVACSFPQHMYFMASEHVARWGFLSKVIRYLGDPILRCKGASSISAVMEMLRRIRNGHNICFFPEGVRTWNGVTKPITTATAKLVRTSGAALITYKLTGAYFSSPMWGGAQVRRGPVRGEIVHIYTQEQVKAMSLQELTDAINADLYEDAYARQLEQPRRYKSKLGAARLENLLFLCPKCGQQDSYHTQGDRICCASCGTAIGYDEYGKLENSAFDTVQKLYDWQCTQVAGDVTQGKPYVAQCGLLRTVENHVSCEVDQGEIYMSPEVLRCGNFQVEMERITELAMHGQRNLVFTVDGKYYEIKVADGGNALKFHSYFQELKERGK